jgi:perosamine synthetase
VAEEYDLRLRGCADLVLPPLSVPDCIVSWFVYVVRLSARFSAADRDAVRRRLNERGIGCGRYFAPIHLQTAYRCQPSAGVRLPVTESQAERTLALPFFNRIKTEQIAEVCGVLIEVTGHAR